MSTRKYKASELITATFHSTGLLETKHVGNRILSPVSDQDKISPYYIYKISCRQVMRKEKYQLWNYPMIQYQILQANIMRIIWQTIKRITNEILGVKEPE